MKLRPLISLLFYLAIALAFLSIYFGIQPISHGWYAMRANNTPINNFLNFAAIIAGVLSAFCFVTVQFLIRRNSKI